MMALKKNNGFSLIEVLISLVIYGTVVSGVVSYLVTNKRVNRQMNIDTMLESNLRIGMDRIIGTMRNAGYGVPNSGLGQWIPASWVSGFTNEPIVITQGATASDPDIISIASCTSQPVMTLTAARNPGATSLAVDDTSLVNTTNKRLILVDESDFAHITTVNNTTTIAIDTNVVTTGAQGLTRNYPIGTEICRVDVTSFDIDSANNKLRKNKNHGSGFKKLVDEIENLQIVTLTAGSQYQVTLTARSNRKDPETGAFPSRSLTTIVTLKN